MSDVVGYRLASQERRAEGLKDRVQQLLAPFDGTERALDSGCGAGALAFVGLGIVIIVIDPGNWLIALGSIVFFGFCAGVGARMLVLRRRAATSRL